MNSVWLSLLWKEWREYRWKMLALTGTLLLSIFVLSAIVSREDSRHEWLSVVSFIQIQWGLFYSYGILASFFLAMGVAAKENGNRTAEFLRALPAASWKPAATKLLMASITTVVPILIGMAVCHSFHRLGFFERGSYISAFGLNTQTDVIAFITDYDIRVTVAAMFTTLSLLWWASALGNNCSDEIRAGAIAFLCIIGWWVFTIYCFRVSDQLTLDAEPALFQIASMGPAGPAYLFEDAPGRNLLGFPALTAYLSPWLLIGQAAALWWFVVRFGKLQPRKTAKGAGVSSPSRSRAIVRRPFKTQLAALAWKQVRETGPLALLALVGSMGFAAVGYWLDESRLNSYAHLFMATTAMVAFFVVMVAGIGTFLDELRPGINDFWRSRPLDLKVWFSMKYATGLIVVVVLLGLPPILAGFTGLASRQEALDYRVWISLFWILSVYLMIYSLSMLFQCLVRQPIYAVVLTLCVFFGGFYLGAFLFGGWKGSLWVPSIALIVTWAVTVFLTWQTVRNDWGWKP